MAVLLGRLVVRDVVVLLDVLGREVVRRAFGVPVSTDPEWHTVNPGRWHIITWRWIEIEKTQQPALLPPQPVYP